MPQNGTFKTFKSTTVATNGMLSPPNQPGTCSFCMTGALAYQYYACVHAPHRRHKLLTMATKKPS